MSPTPVFRQAGLRDGAPTSRTGAPKEAEAAPRQSWHADRYATNARFVAELSAPVIELLAPRPGERILDLGCGDGALTEKLAALGCSVIGVDGAADMVAAARRRGLAAYVADGENLRFAAEFDAVFSKRLCIGCVTRTPRSGASRARSSPAAGSSASSGPRQRRSDHCRSGRGARRARVGRRGREPVVSPECRGLCGPARKPGSVVDQVELIRRPTVLPTDVAGWLDTFAESFRQLPEKQRGAARNEVPDLLSPCLCDERDDGPPTTSGCALLPIPTGEPAVEALTARREFGRDRRVG